MNEAELAGRTRLPQRRVRPSRVKRLEVGDGLDLDRRELRRHAVWVHLRPKEASLLELFARAPGRAMTRDHVLVRVWGPDHQGDSRTVDVHVRWLRLKIAPGPRAAIWLLTIRGVGYHLDTTPLPAVNRPLTGLQPRVHVGDPDSAEHHQHGLGHSTA